MSSDEEYLDRLLRSVENKESEIKTDVLPDIPVIPQDVVMPADIEEPFDVLSAMNDIDITGAAEDNSDHMVEEMRTAGPTPNLSEPVVLTDEDLYFNGNPEKLTSEDYEIGSISYFIQSKDDFCFVMQLKESD